MKIFLTLLSTSLFLHAAPIITGGSITAGSSAAGGSSLSVNLTGPGLSIIYGDNRNSFVLPPYCTAACTFDFSQSVVISLNGNFLVDGTQYNLATGTLTLNFASAIASATPTCTGGCGTNPGPSNYVTTWAPQAFTVTGTLVLRDTRQFDVPVVYNQSFTATGFATAVSDSIPPGSLTDGRQVTYRFTDSGANTGVPEPAAAQMMIGGLLAGLGIVSFRKR